MPLEDLVEQDPVDEAAEADPEQQAGPVDPGGRDVMGRSEGDAGTAQRGAALSGAP